MAQASTRTNACNSDEALRCVKEAELLLLGAPNWHEERKLEMISKAVRLLRKSNQMSAATMPSVPQWLAMRASPAVANQPLAGVCGITMLSGSRLQPDVIQNAQRIYARIILDRPDTPQGSSEASGGSSSSSSGAGNNASGSRNAPSSEQADENACFFRVAWGKLKYVVYDWSGFGRYFSPEWKSTILTIYMIIVVLTIVRLSYGAPLRTLFQYHYPGTDIKDGTGYDYDASNLSPLRPDIPLGVPLPDYRMGPGLPREERYIEQSSILANVQVYFPLLSWVAFFFIPIALQQFQGPAAPA